MEPKIVFLIVDKSQHIYGTVSQDMNQLSQNWSPKNH